MDYAGFRRDWAVIDKGESEKAGIVRMFAYLYVSGWKKVTIEQVSEAYEEWKKDPLG
jgi:hypothetical protein